MQSFTHISGHTETDHLRFHNNCAWNSTHIEFTFMPFQPKFHCQATGTEWLPWPSIQQCIALARSLTIRYCDFNNRHKGILVWTHKIRCMRITGITGCSTNYRILNCLIRCLIHTRMIPVMDLHGMFLAAANNRTNWLFATLFCCVGAPQAIMTKFIRVHNM